MVTKFCPHVTNIKNKGIAAQADFTIACNQTYTHHDNVSFNMGSDIEYMGRKISVKAYHFTLMAGTLCEGKTTLPEIWEVYAKNTHSDSFAYIMDEIAYIMDLNEFKEFVFNFCEVEKESNHSDKRHTDSYKIRAKRCEKRMKEWFETIM